MDAIAPADLQRAVRLYAAQAARDSISGRESLRLMADWALASPTRAIHLIDDPVLSLIHICHSDSFECARMQPLKGIAEKPSVPLKLPS